MVTPIELFCEDETNDGAGNFDLLGSSVVEENGGYRFTASYLGPTEGRVVLVAFYVGEFEYQVGGQIFDDGSPPVAFSYDFGPRGRNTDIEDQIVVPGQVSIRVPNKLIKRVARTQFTVETILNVDGTDIDTCPQGV